MMATHMPKPHREPAVLVLENGAVYPGWACGALGKAFGEVVFHTAMTGYQEVLSDPSYYGQMVAFTYPHIGNQGVNPRDNESAKWWVAGVVVRDLVTAYSNYRAYRDLASALRLAGIVAIAGVDTRALTHTLREAGALRGGIYTGEAARGDPALWRAEVGAHPRLSGRDLTAAVGTNAPYRWEEGSGEWLAQSRVHLPIRDKTVVVYDFGVKYSILRMLRDRVQRVWVVPAHMPVADVEALKPDGIVFSNGPGDPEACTAIIAQIQIWLQKTYPLFGICLGHQLLALASGARTFKMKFGHHGANHPVQDQETGRVRITSQNHGFAVDPATLPPDLIPTHIALFDGTLQGYRGVHRPIWGFQGHPEAGPGPHDMGDMMDTFIASL